MQMLFAATSVRPRALADISSSATFASGESGCAGVPMRIVAAAVAVLIVTALTAAAQNPSARAPGATAKPAQAGWSMVDDPVTGARLGIPTKQVRSGSQGKNGTRWASAQGQVQIETFKIREPGTTLASVYEQQKKEPSTRKLAVNLLRPDFFLLSGMQGLKRFYVRAEIRDGEVRGLTVLYDQATETIMDPVAVVMASIFTA